MKIYTKLSAMRAVSSLAAQSDIRYYLNGVLVEANWSITRLVATNGHVMGLYEDVSVEPNEVSQAISFIVPFDAIAALKPAKNKLDQLVIETVDGKTGTLTVIGGMSVNFTSVDGKFPDYVRVIPKSVSGEVAQFNPDYIADFKKAHKLLGAKTFHIHHNGLQGAAVDFGMSNFLGVMMPMRSDITYNPSTFGQSLIVQLQAAA